MLILRKKVIVLLTTFSQYTVRNFDLLDFPWFYTLQFFVEIDFTYFMKVLSFKWK